MKGLVVSELLRTSRTPRRWSAGSSGRRSKARRTTTAASTYYAGLLPISETEDGIRVAQSLGTAVFGNWSDAMRRTLIPMIHDDLMRSSEDADVARAVVRSFLYSTDPR